MKQDLKDKLFEEMLRSALEEHSETPVLQSEFELRSKGIMPHAFSSAFERKMNRLLRKERRASWRKLHRKTLQHIAACTAFAVLVGGAAIVKVDALRVPIFSFFMRIGEKYSIIHIENTAKITGISEELSEYLPTYVPEGFFAASVWEDENSASIEYRNEKDDFFIFDFWKAAPGGAVDTEDSTVTETQILEHPAIIIEKDARIILIWMPNGHEYNITGTISKEDAIRILESIKKNF